MKIGCVLLAAGAGMRFGGGKLLHEIEGEPMIQRALHLYRDIPFTARVCVTRAGATEIQRFARESGFPIAINPNPDRGVGTSVSIATSAILEREPELDGILYAVADQPYLTRESLDQLLEAFEAHPSDIASLCFGDRRGNPAIFPKDLFQELCALSLDIGGGAIIRRYPDRLRLVKAQTARELDDIDTIDDLIE